MTQEEGIADCERLFAKYLDGHALLSNASHLRGSATRIQFPRVVWRRRVHCIYYPDTAAGAAAPPTGRSWGAPAGPSY